MTVYSGSHKQFIKVFDMEGTTLNVIKYHEGFLGQRIGPISSLAFHPYVQTCSARALSALNVQTVLRSLTVV